jgi:hypothetical protein
MTTRTRPLPARFECRFPTGLGAALLELARLEDTSMATIVRDCLEARLAAAGLWKAPAARAAAAANGASR